MILCDDRKSSDRFSLSFILWRLPDSIPIVSLRLRQLLSSFYWLLNTIKRQGIRNPQSTSTKEWKAVWLPDSIRDNTHCMFFNSLIASTWSLIPWNQLEVDSQLIPWDTSGGRERKRKDVQQPSCPDYKTDQLCWFKVSSLLFKNQLSCLL